MLGLCIIRHLVTRGIKHQFTIVYSTAIYEEKTIVLIAYDPGSEKITAASLVWPNFSWNNNIAKWTRAPNNWYIIDGRRIGDAAACSCNAIGLISPQHDESYSEHKKYSPKILYMPVWTREEMKAVSENIYNDDLQKECFEDLLNTFGPIPRRVFQPVEPSCHTPDGKLKWLQSKNVEVETAIGVQFTRRT